MNSKKIKYPDFYKILITKKVAEKINLREDVPLVEIFEIKKNKSFIAKRAKIFSEEKTIPSNAPIGAFEGIVFSSENIFALFAINDLFFLISKISTNGTSSLRFIFSATFLVIKIL